MFTLQCSNSLLIENRGLKPEDLVRLSQSKKFHLESFILALTGEPFHKNPFAVLRNTCTQKAVSRAPFSRKAGSDSRRVSCNFPLPEMKRKQPPPPPPRPTPSSKRKEGNGERNGLIKGKEEKIMSEGGRREGRERTGVPLEKSLLKQGRPGQELN